MVKAAEGRLVGCRNVELHTTAVETFPLRSGQFDLILCHQVFPHFVDKEKVLRILSRVLRKGGKLIVFHFISFDRINDRHRKAGTAVEQDMMPVQEEMERLFTVAGLTVAFIRDDDLGYFLSASKGERDQAA
jgi:demethylmenaquinone methyltransferase/2-methoxy-6-polyprenyl-1,4-benzoquinol methylase